MHHCPPPPAPAPRPRHSSARQVEGRGNGIKTVIPNMVEVSKALCRPPAYVTKYLGMELGAQVQMYPADERYIVNGQFTAERFQELLHGFIKKFVLCASCKNPETKIRLKKKAIEMRCGACGNVFSPVPHKLQTYIMNNPPDGGGDKGGSKGGKADRRSAKAAGGGGTAGDVDERDAEVDAMGAEEEDDDDDDDWAVDTSEAAVRARTAALGGGVTHLTHTDDLDKSMSERLAIFADYISERLKLPKLPQKEVIKEAERLDCKEKGTMVLVQGLLLEGDVLATLAKYQGLFQRFTVDNDKAQKYFLGAIEKLIEQRPELLAKTAHLFKQLYDLDLVDEERFLAWGAKTSKKNVSAELSAQIHAKAKAFLQWLEEAEEEESSEDDTTFAEAAPAAPAAPAAAAAEDGGDDGEEEVDIDDI